MARQAELYYGGLATPPPLAGVAITRRGYGEPLERLTLIEAAHPVPDETSVQAARTAMELAAGATENDLVLFLISGGASALCAAPAGDITLAEKRALTAALLKSGARIHEINCVRKHISRFKGGRLAALAYPATLVTLAISDTPGDEPETKAPVPPAPDPTTHRRRRAKFSRNTGSMRQPLSWPRFTTPRTRRRSPAIRFLRTPATTSWRRGATLLEAAGEVARGLGYDVIMLGDLLEGEARDVAHLHAQLAKRCLADGRRAVILSGGELTVTVKGNGSGGPNQEYALALAIALKGQAGIAAFAGDTDGTDGGEGNPKDPAGAYIDPTTLGRAASLNLAPATFLANNDSTGFFRLTNDLLVCGPTGTNVNDFRAIVVDSTIRD